MEPNDGPLHAPGSGAPRSADALGFQLLGDFRVWIGNTEVPPSALRRRKLRSLVKLLALEPDHRLHRDRVIDLLWPDLSPSSAASQLHNTLSQARKALAWPPDHPAEVRLTLHGGMVALQARGGVQTDVQAFSALEEDARSRPTVEKLERALAGYAGDLLPGDLYEAWSSGPRTALQERHLALLCRLGDAYLEAGRLADAVPVFEEALRREPLHEAAHRGLMQAYVGLGTPSRARRQLEAYSQALHEELGAQPSPELRGLLHERPSAPTDDPPAELPLQATPFVGRAFELSEIETMLSDPACRLLTLVGLGGIGKTRLALEAASRQRSRFAHGLAFVALNQVSSAQQLVVAIAEALRLPAVEGDPWPRLDRFLRGRHLLLLLDDADRAVPAAGLLIELLDGHPGLRFLVTSRQRLCLRNEWLLEVGGLEVPREEARADPARFSAIQLFLQGARRVRPGFEPSPEQIAAVQRICRRLRGVPLAIEIASSWTATLACEEIAAELTKDIDLGLAPFRDVPERHQSLRSAFEYSWGLLDAEERLALSRLAVFHGGFGREAAKRVTGATLGVLARLSSKSLVGRTADEKFEIHPVLRRFALEKLEPRTDEPRMGESHARYYLDRLHDWEQAFRHAATGEALRAIGSDIENMRAAWAWASRAGRSDLLDRGLHGLFAYLELRGWMEEGVEVFGRSAQALTGIGDRRSEIVRARLLGRQGAFCYRLGRARQARRLLASSSAILEQAGEHAEQAFLLDRLGVLCHEAGDDSGAARLLHRALALRQDLGDLYGTAVSLNNLGSLAFATSDRAGAERFFLRSLAIQQELASPKAAAISLQNLASLSFSRGRLDEANERLREALTLARSAGDPALGCILLSHLGIVLAARGQRLRSKRCFGQALEEARGLGAAALELRTVLHLASALGEDGEDLRSFELCAYVLQDPAAPHDVRTGAARQQAALVDRLPPALVREIDRKVRATLLDEVIAELLQARSGPPDPA